jgi:predicted transcriptional regulator
MTWTTATPKEITEILALREAGYTCLAVSQRTGFSLRTIHRHLAAHGTKKGRIKSELIENARAELLSLISDSPAIKAQAAKLVHDDIAMASHIRNIVIDASEHLKATNLQDAIQVMKAAAAFATVVKLTSDTQRLSLSVDKLVDDVDDLPELVIQEITNEQAIAMRGELVEKDG